MAVRAGEQAWIPCMATPGPFSDERMIRIETETGEWLGFVDVSSLREKIEEGKTFVLAAILEVTGDTLTAIIPGRSIGPATIRHSAALSEPRGSLQA